MKSFKEFSNKKKISWLSIPSFAETRHLQKDSKKTSWLNFDGSFAAVRNKKLQEEVDWENFTGKFHKSSNTKPTSNKLANYDKHLDSEHIKPDDSENWEHPDFLRHYSSAESNSSNGHRSSSNINNHLRHLTGQPVAEGGENTQGIVGRHSPEKVKQAIKDLSATFHEKSTNREAIKVYSGVPRHIGKQIESAGKGSEHRNAGFLSTTTEQAAAKDFGKSYHSKHYIYDDSEPYHVLQIHAHPGSVRSVAQYSPYNEHEMLIHHGTKLTYSHTTEGTDSVGHKFKVHHLEAHPDRLPLPL